MTEPSSNLPPDAAPLVEQLRALYAELQSAFSAQWNRTLPLADYLVDRWEKARLLGFGEGSSIYDSALVFGDVRVGRDTWVGPQALLDGSGGGLTIGDNCCLATGVHVYTHDSVARTVTGGRAPLEHASTRTGNRVYIGPYAIVAKGVTIGDECVIGAKSLVLTDIPPRTKAFGIPCKEAGAVDPEELLRRAQAEQGDSDDE